MELFTRGTCSAFLTGRRSLTSQWPSVRMSTILSIATYELLDLYYEAVPDTLNSEEFFEQLESKSNVDITSSLRDMIRDEEA